MENIPFYVSVVFILTTCLTAWFFYKASGQSKKILTIIIVWTVIQSAIALTGFYLHTSSIPPRFVLLVAPPLLSIALLFATASGRKLIDKFDACWLTWLHVVRIPVEIVLFWLFVYKAVPQLITFEGKNFDIISGITAIPVAYLGYHKKQLPGSLLIAWNIACLGLLFNVVIRAVLSAPFPFQQFAFDQPNVAILYFPFILLPGLVVPMVLFSHLICTRKLMNGSAGQAK